MFTDDVVAEAWAELLDEGKPVTADLLRKAFGKDSLVFTTDGVLGVHPETFRFQQWKEKLMPKGGWVIFLCWIQALQLHLNEKQGVVMAAGSRRRWLDMALLNESGNPQFSLWSMEDEVALKKGRGETVSTDPPHAFLLQQLMEPMLLHQMRVTKQLLQEKLDLTLPDAAHPARIVELMMKSPPTSMLMTRTERRENSLLECVADKLWALLTAFAFVLEWHSNVRSRVELVALHAESASKPKLMDAHDLLGSLCQLVLAQHEVMQILRNVSQQEEAWILLQVA